MTLFLSTFKNKVDKKGRISVPATFRSQIKDSKYNGIIVYESFINSCIEACDFERIENINKSLDNLDPFSQERDAFATSLMASSTQLNLDGDGRITVPELVISTAQIKEEALFVGKGSTFEIWNPELFVEYQQKARAIAASNRDLLKMSRGLGDAK